MNKRVQRIFHFLLVCVFGGIGSLSCLKPVTYEQTTPISTSDFPLGDDARFVGELKNPHLSECSGMDASPTQKDLLWAINDSGNGPYIFAMGINGQNLGRVHIRNIINRDWEGLDAFLWHGESYLIVADIGDNKRQYPSNHLYIIREPNLADFSPNQNINTDIAWRIEFTYPDGAHDAECVAVDIEKGSVLVLTKRDSPPIVFEVPLQAHNPLEPVTAKRLTPVPFIPPPASEDLSKPYGDLSSQPTDMDISADGHQIVILTYKHAYLFKRLPNQTWEEVLSGTPQLLALPSPYQHPTLRQRESICFSSDDRNLFVTSEGVGAGIYRLGINR